MIARMSVRGGLAAIVLAGTLVGGPAQLLAQTLDHRSWQFQDPNWDYLQQAIPKAQQAGMNRIQLSHAIVMDAEQLWEGKDATERLAVVRKATSLAHEHGLKVDMWTHELSGVPEGRFRDADGKVRLDAALWQWVEQKYERVFKLVPELDGLVLTFAETDYKVYGAKVASDEPEPKRVAELIAAIDKVCARHDKLLLVRTFVYEPQEIAWIREALRETAAATAEMGHLAIMTKCVPHDWTPYYPFNPLLGDAAGLPQIVEIDLGEEFTGQSRILHCEPEYVRSVMDHARAKGVIGAVARVERYENKAIGTPNEVNLYAFGRLLVDASVSPESLWLEWATRRYGEKAAPFVIRALRRTFDITNLTFFPCEYWITNHSRIPSWSYAYGHITSRQNAKWIPSPKQLRWRDALLRPNADTLEWIAAEKDLAAKLCERALGDLEQAKAHLKTEDYDELKRYLTFGADVVECFRHQQLGMFAALACQNPKRQGAATEPEIAQMRARAMGHAKSLREWADVMEKKYGKDVWPGNPERCRAFAAEVEQQAKE